MSTINPTEPRTLAQTTIRQLAKGEAGRITVDQAKPAFGADTFERVDANADGFVDEAELTRAFAAASPELRKRYVDGKNLMAVMDKVRIGAFISYGVAAVTGLAALMRLLTPTVAMTFGLIGYAGLLASMYFGRDIETATPKLDRMLAG